ncbi:carboxypeptidase regulatory-like domain-containing protein [Streptomyces sp. NPDC018000]|uniref:carboxypeptidase regulatory-like domain-containing protein n=1 Tax=Streptomyces sp. NPDC018000 TaxID=3365028 RepID=UPI0037B3DA2A
MAFAVAAATVIAVPTAASASTPSAKHPVPTTKAAGSTSPGRHPADQVCAKPSKAGEMSCLAMVRTDVVAAKGLQADAAPAGFGPADLRSAYNLPDAGSTETVAVVAAFDNPHAEADLAVYRQQYGLPQCTTANGCFKKIDQRGATSYPPANSQWAAEIALDIDMVSATCPSCKILLVEADDNSLKNLGAAVNQAVAQGAKYVSNSWGSTETPDEPQSDEAYFNHPGVAITFASGDSGYRVAYPAASQYVTAVGGTSLVKDTSTTRGWAESAWRYAGSGCSRFVSKPSFQQDTGCARRTITDVSAVADPSTGVAVYNGGWQVFGGTSASAPIIASVYALAGKPAAGSAPSSYPYAQPATLNDVTSGSNGSCTAAYLCNGGPGYDGPTGLGTPNGVAAFRPVPSGPRGTVAGTVTDGTSPLAAAKVTVGDATVMTDGQGRYALTVSAGTYDVSASKFGYATKTVSGVAIADGQTVTEDFALSSKSRVNVTGTVHDASGQGWPLYATVRVKDEPTAVAYTDPKTGKYTLSVPVSGTYTLQVDPLYSGYKRNSQDVPVGSADVTHDVNASIDPMSCTAAGYGFHYNGTTEPFDGTSVPTGWTVDDKVGNGQTWVFKDPRDRPNRTGGSGGFAVIDSDYHGRDSSQDSSLISPVMDFSQEAQPVLTFHSDYNGMVYQTGDVDLSVDGGQTWNTLWHHANDRAWGPRTEVVDLSQAAGKAKVQVRFHFTAKWGMWWQVDDVRLGGRTCDPLPGGLVVGRVTDKNTGAGINGATVTSGDKPAEKTTSAATPNNPKLGDGFYWMFSSLTGDHKFNAKVGNYYSPQDITVNVAPHEATDAAFALPAPRIAVPAQVSATVDWEGQGNSTLTLKNTGTAPVTTKIREWPVAPSGNQPAAAQQGAPLQQVKGDYSPLPFRPGKTARAAAKPSVTPYAAPWTTAADYPMPVMDNAVATINGKVYSVGGFDDTYFVNKAYAYDPGAQAWSALPNMSVARGGAQAAAHGGKLYAFGGWDNYTRPVAKTEIYDPASGTWSTGADNPQPRSGAGVAELGGKIYLVGGCIGNDCGKTNVQVYDPAANSWSSGTAYPEKVSWLGCGAIEDKLYCAGGQGPASTHAYSYDPATARWTRVADLPIELWGMGYSVSAGKLLVSGGVTDHSSVLTNKGFAYDPGSDAWTALPNSNNTLYRAGSACGFYKIGGSAGNYYGSRNSELLPGYDQCAATGDVPWLSVDKTEVTIQPGESVDVNASFDASLAQITQPGTVTAQLTIGAKTPYGAIPSVPVALTVNPPKTWGKITGTVAGVGCTGKSAPLTGATVQIASKTASFTLKTDKNGQYVLWLDVRDNPVTVTASKDGWEPQTRSVGIKPGKATTADFSLKEICS